MTRWPEALIAERGRVLVLDGPAAAGAGHQPRWERNAQKKECGGALWLTWW